MFKKRAIFVTAILQVMFLSLAGNLAGAADYSTAVTVSSSSAPTVTSVSPATGENTASISISSISGTGFQGGITVKLSKSGESDISCAGFTFASGSELTSGSCPITGATAGSWDLVVKNTDHQSGTLAGGFTVTAPQSSSPAQNTENNGANGGHSLIVRVLQEPIAVIKKLLGLDPDKIPASFAKGDFNGDNLTDIVDLSILLYQFEYGDAEKRYLYDLNLDGELNVFDISIFLYYWS